MGEKGLGGEGERVLLRIPRETYYLCLARRAVVEVARRGGFSVRATAEIEMAVDEACSNAIRHAREAGPDSAGQGISLDVAVDQGGITVTICDGGEPFAFDRCGKADLESYHAELTEGGLGVYIIRRFMDEVECRHRPEVGNILRMRKYLGATGDSQPRTIVGAESPEG